MAAVALWTASAAYAQFDFLAFELEHPAIQYRLTPPSDPVARLNDQLERGERSLVFGGPSGYLRSLLDVLEIPVESQIVVYSTTSLQGSRIRHDNPRAIYFNDSVAVAWVRGGFIEIASHDPRQGAMFYLLPQSFVPEPRAQRDGRCLGCHYTASAQGVPGFFVRSIPTAGDGSPMPWLGNATPDHREPLADRWGGWYVTGRTEAAHLGNLVFTDRLAKELPRRTGNQALPTLADKFPTRDYLSPHSDIAALLVFDHQARMMNLITRLGWEARALAHDGRPAGALDPLVREFVDYLLFVDEAPLAPVRGSSAFTQTFPARGPRDRSGRSLRDLDLDRRLLRYPCSYMIYSPAFDAMPATAKDAVYDRMAAVLGGQDTAPRYARLTAADRRAVIEILRDTKRDLPESILRLFRS